MYVLFNLPPADGHRAEPPAAWDSPAAALLSLSSSAHYGSLPLDNSAQMSIPPPQPQRCGVRYILVVVYVVSGPRDKNRACSLFDDACSTPLGELRWRGSDC